MVRTFLRTIGRARWGAVVVALAVAGCSSDGPGVLTRSTESTISSDRTTAATTVAASIPLTTQPATTEPVTTAPPTTVAATSPPTVSPLDISQPIVPSAFLPESDESCRDAVSRDLGESWEVECYQGWASGGQTAYYDECTECEGLSMLQLSNGRWSEVGSCHAYHVASCGLENLVPREALCVLWYSNSMLGELWRTGCAPRHDDLIEVQTENCDDYYEEYFDEGWATSLTCLKGETVRRAQVALQQLGYAIDADGYFGPASARAVAAFQRANGMTISAVLDEPTRRALVGG